jgi:phosphohistidine phosphatase
MRQLLLLRHAKSSWDDAKMPDRDRPLNPRGRRNAVALRQAMRELGLAPDLVLVSSAKRTSETLEALEPWDDTPLIEPMDGLYLATAPQLLAVLQGVAETVRSVLLIGHNPGLHDLATSLTEGRPTADQQREAERRLAAGFPTASLAEFAIAGPWWQIGPRAGRLLRFLTPADLTEAKPGPTD